MTNKKDGKITEAGVVELEENKLDNVTGGVGYIKIGGIKGESLKPQRLGVVEKGTAGLKQ